MKEKEKIKEIFDKFEKKHLNWKEPDDNFSCWTIIRKDDFDSLKSSFQKEFEGLIGEKNTAEWSISVLKNKLREKEKEIERLKHEIEFDDGALSLAEKRVQILEQKDKERTEKINKKIEELILENKVKGFVNQETVTVIKELKSLLESEKDSVATVENSQERHGVKGATG